MPRVNTTVLDSILTAVNTPGVEIYVCETRPLTRADALANALHGTLVTRTPGKAVSGAAGLTVDGSDRRYTDGPYQNVTLDAITGSQTPVFVAVTDLSNLLLVADTTGASPLPNNTVIDLSSWDHIIQGPTV